MISINWPDLLPLAQAIGWTLIHSLWQITLVSVVLWWLLQVVPAKHSNLRYSMLTFTGWPCCGMPGSLSCRFIYLLASTN